jgi:elongation factor P
VALITPTTTSGRFFSQFILPSSGSCNVQAKDIKTGTVVVHNGNPVIIQGISVHSPSARGAATLYKFRARNVVTGNKVDLTLKGTESLGEADFSRRNVQLMYSDATSMFLMDQEDYQQYELPLEDLEEQLPYITEGLEGMRAMIYNDSCVGLEVPASVELLITECDPGVKGNSATSRTKPATLETGLIVQVPEYIKQGEKLKIDTRTGEYLSRA